MLAEPVAIPGLDARSRALRLQIVDMIAASGAGHVGPAFSIVEILRVLYDDILRINAPPASDPARDRLILSKGHGCAALYAILADRGFLPKTALADFCRFDAALGGHPERRVEWGIEATTGALGHGLAMGVGCALAARMTGLAFRVFVIVGDGELNEGSNWEAAFHARKHGLDNLMVIVDRNGQQCHGPSGLVLEGFDLPRLWTAAGWDVQVVDGHDCAAIRAGVAAGLGAPGPAVLICDTIKNCGGGPFAADPAWHYKAGFTTDELVTLRTALSAGND